MTAQTLGTAFDLNPRVALAKGVVAPFVEMAALRPFTRTVHATVAKPYTSGTKFLNGDVLMARITPSLENGKTSVYRAAPGLERQPAFGSTEFIVIRGRDRVTDSGFAFYLFTSEQIRQFAISTMTGTSGRQRVQHDALASFVVDLPTFPEQQRIARALGALDDKIESNLRAIALADELTRARFSRLFDMTPRDRGVALASLCTVAPSRRLTAGTPATYLGMSSLPEVSPEVFDWETRETGSGQRFQNGDVLMARITPCLENGKTGVVDMLKPGEVGWGSTEYIVLAPRGPITTAWIYCAARDKEVRDFAIRSMTGTSGRQRVSAERFGQYRVAAPAAAALHDFNSLAEPLFTHMTHLRDEVNQLAGLRDALVPELLSRRISVPEVTEQIGVAA